ncbi:MAG: alpha,alpha-phosphotrehalase [Coriobacteriaceae bacterium]|nr:alpha,alpha-phosphotrehalase [Coriobacteriaceae bacterium]
MQDRAEQLGDKVVYQIYIRSFNDSNGDGIGDIRGITQRLDYLKGLGVDYLWITPFFSSPQVDNGYDVADYRTIEPMYGTMADFDELAREAGARGIGLMLDMVFNHTSTSHAWFQRALAGDPKYLAYYKFVDAAPGASAKDPGEPPTNWLSKFGGSAWEYVPSLNKWYLHLFDTSQADLNWDNPEVRRELADVVRFWKDRGVSGFRFDVVNLISKPDHLEDDDEGDGRRFYTDGPHVHEYIRELVREGGLDGMVTVGEMSSTSIESCIRYSAPRYHELSQTFSFHHLKVDYRDGDKWALAEPNIAALRDILASWQEGMTAGGGWNALFWSNHDQPRPNSRFGDCANEEGCRRSSELVGTINHLMRGTPYIYQGEELGMTDPGFASIDEYRDVESLNYYRILQDEGKTPEEALHIIARRSRDNGRTPMQWDGSKHAGFTTGTPWINIPANHTTINARAEVCDPDSVWSYYRRLISLRKETPVIQRGSVRFLDALSDKVIAFERTLENAPSGPGHLVVLCNFSGMCQPAVASDGLAKGSLLIANARDMHDEEGTLVLGPWVAAAFAW